MKKLFKACAISAAFTTAACTGCFFNMFDEDTFLTKTGLKEIPGYETFYSSDTHGGFHGDGELTIVLTFNATNAAKLEEQLETADYWLPLPMNGIVEQLFYRNEYFTSYPEAENGYYFFYDKQTKSHTLPPDDYFETSYSHNVRISVFDSDNLTLYYYELDT